MGCIAACKSCNGTSCLNSRVDREDLMLDSDESTDEFLADDEGGVDKTFSDVMAAAIDDEYLDFLMLWALEEEIVFS